MSTSPTKLVDLDPSLLKLVRDAMNVKYPKVEVASAADLSGINRDDMLFRAGQRSVVAELEDTIRVVTEKRKS